jgi:hypothetical protein
VGIDDRLDDRKTQAGGACRAIAGRIGLIEALEEVRQVARGDPRPSSRTLTQTLRPDDRDSITTAPPDGVSRMALSRCARVEAAMSTVYGADGRPHRERWRAR